MAVTNQDLRDSKHWEAVEEATELLQEQSYEQALLVLRDVLLADPNNPYAYQYLGAAFFELKKLDAARDAYVAAVRLSPDFLGSRVALSHVLRLLGDTKGALAQAKEAVRRFPKDGDAMHAAALAFAARGERKHAREQLEAFLKSNPELEAQLEARQMLQLLGQGDEGEPMEFDE